MSVDKLNEKISTLNERMGHLEMTGSHGSNAYQQCLYWMQQINYELEERAFMDEVDNDPAWSPGIVATIGEVPRPIIGEAPKSERSKDNGKT